MEDKTSASLMTIISIVRAFRREQNLGLACVDARAQGATPNMVRLLAAMRLAEQFSVEHDEKRLFAELRKIGVY